MRLISLLSILMLVGGMIMASEIPKDIQKLIDQGEYGKARKALEKASEKKGISDSGRRSLLFEAERLRRIPIDFKLTTDDVLRQIKKDIPDATMEDVKTWTADGTLEGRMIDGKQCYYRRAVRNLYILNEKAASRREKFEKEKKEKETDQYGQAIDMKVHAKAALEARKKADSPLVTPKRFRVDYSLSVNPGQVPKGELIRCWLPFPKEVRTQEDIKLVSSSPEKCVIAPNECDQRTVYLEQPSKGDEPTKFSIAFEYTAYAFVKPIDPEKIEPYDTSSELYKKYTAERPTQIVFTPEIRQMAKEICKDEANPYLRAKRIFEWVQTNIPWSGAIEYSLAPNLAMRALKRRTGDCGMQGLLFINLCRVSGVPARWQSGWSLRPTKENMHDWAEFYVEPYGWLYADASRGLMDSEDPGVKWFNFGNFDPYRMIVNTNYGARLHPPKEHFRSEPVDFQRGEVEWKGGNLYFNQWNWDFDVRPLSARIKATGTPE